MTDTRTAPTASRTAPGVNTALLAVAVVWGSSYAVAGDVVTADTVFGFLVARFGIAVVALAIPLTPRLRETTRAECGLGALFGLLLAAILVLETFGLTRTSAANAGLIISLTMVITPLLDRTRPLPRTFHLATGTAVLGVVLLTQSAGPAVPGLGDLLILLAACVRAVHVTVMARYTAGRAHDPSRMTLIQLATVLAVALALSAGHGVGLGATFVAMTATDWLRTAYLALACTLCAFYAQMWAVRHTSPSRVGLLLGTEPVWALAFGVALAGEPLTATTLLGAALVLTGTTWGRTIDARRAELDRGREYRSVRDSGRRYWGGRRGCP